MTRTTRFSLALLCLTLAAVLPTPAMAQTLAFSQSFDPVEIGPGSASTLQFSITNTSATPVTGIAFTDNLPAGMTVTSPAADFSTCSGTLSAPAGGGTIDLSDASLAGGDTCTIIVHVTSSAAGTQDNTTGPISSSAGSDTTSSASLTVATDRPGFTKSFSPSTVSFNGSARLTFTIDNSASSESAIRLTFNDTLPPGMTVATPANATSTCSGGIVTAPAGGNTIGYAPAQFLDASVPAGGTCTVAVDVVVGGVGELVNVSDNLSATSQVNFQIRSGGKAIAGVTGTPERLVLSKRFLNGPVSPGSTVDLEFSIRNIDRGNTITDIAFTDDLDAALPGLTAVDLPTDPCGGGSTLTGSSLLTFAGGTLASGDTCTFTATLQVPASAAPSKYLNITSAPTGDANGTTITGPPAIGALSVSAAPALTKTFLDNPAGAGATVTMELSLTNVSTSSSATDIAFSDNLTLLSGVTVASVPASGFCGSGSTATVVNTGLSNQINVSGASLAAGASCTFGFDLAVPASSPAGGYLNTTTAPTATVDGVAVTGKAASDTLVIVGTPQLQKDFIDDPVLAGGTVTLELTVSYGAEQLGEATEISFTDDLDAVIPGMVATGLPQTAICGPASELSGTSTLAFSGGSLSPGESCSFAVTLQVPASALSGTATSTTSSVTAIVDEVLTEGAAANTELLVAGLDATKTFTGDPVIAGGSVTLTFLLVNETDVAVTDMTFTDDLGAMVSGATPSGVPMVDPCGPGSNLTAAGSLLLFSGGNLGAGASCSFDVTVTVPASTADGTYPNTTSSVVARFDGTQAAVGPAVDGLVVDSSVLDLAKQFTDDPASPGDLVTLQLTVTNLHPTATVDDITFSDDLDAALAGLTSVSGTIPDVCGTGSQVAGTSVLTLTGGSLAAGASCTFAVTLQVPADVALGTTAVNTTGTVSGTTGGLGVEGGTATDTLTIDFLDLAKSFAGPAEAGDTVALTFTITNLSGDPVAGVSFLDDLDAALAGLQATSLPSAPCGAGSMITGTSVLVLSDASLLPNASCSFVVDVEIPAAAAPGTYTNVTSHLRQGGIEVASPAAADLTVLEVLDGDDDGVLDDVDFCPETVVPEGVPTRRLGTNRYALVDGDGIFDTEMPNGGGPFGVFTIADTAGCSCEQIIELLDLGRGHERFGCSLGAMRDWVELVSAP